MHRIASLFAVTALAGCATLPPAAGLPAGSKYVAMGSSFAAGAGIGPVKSGTPERCSRTTNNYASLLAAELNLALDDQSCGGATTAHLLGPWDELPAQLDAVDETTRLVTITVGGNNLDYVSNLFVAMMCGPDAPIPTEDERMQCPPVTVPTDADYARVEQSLHEVAGEVRARAPQARLVFVQYVKLVPDEPCAAANLPADDAAIIRTIGLRLADLTARVARDTGAMLLPADVMSRDHTPCDAEPWATGLSADFDRSQGAPWHPTPAGHAAIAEALAAKIR